MKSDSLKSTLKKYVSFTQVFKIVSLPIDVVPLIHEALLQTKLLISYQVLGDNHSYKTNQNGNMHNRLGKEPSDLIFNHAIFWTEG